MQVTFWRSWPCAPCSRPVRSVATPLSALPRRLARGLARYKGKSLMPRANARHGPLAKQLNECARDGNVAGALTLFDGSDATLSTRSYNSLLTLLVDGHRDDFRRVRDHMRAAGVAVGRRANRILKI